MFTQADIEFLDATPDGECRCIHFQDDNDRMWTRERDRRPDIVTRINAGARATVTVNHEAIVSDEIEMSDITPAPPSQHVQDFHDIMSKAPDPKSHPQTYHAYCELVKSYFFNTRPKG